MFFAREREKLHCALSPPASNHQGLHGGWSVSLATFPARTHFQQGPIRADFSAAQAAAKTTGDGFAVHSLGCVCGCSLTSRGCSLPGDQPVCPALVRPGPSWWCAVPFRWHDYEGGVLVCGRCSSSPHHR